MILVKKIVLLKLYKDQDLNGFGNVYFIYKLLKVIPELDQENIFMKLKLFRFIILLIIKDLWVNKKTIVNLMMIDRDQIFENNQLNRVTIGWSTESSHWDLGHDN